MLFAAAHVSRRVRELLSVTIRGPRESRILPVLTLDPNEPPVSRFTREGKIEGIAGTIAGQCRVHCY